MHVYTFIYPEIQILKVIPVKAISETTGSFLEIQNPMPLPRPITSEIPEVGPYVLMALQVTVGPGGLRTSALTHTCLPEGNSLISLYLTFQLQFLFYLSGKAFAST